MDAQATARIPRPFLNMPDPRSSNHRHKLIDILTIALFAILSGCEDWVTVVLYARKKIDWLKTFLDLSRGIPSHDTFGDVFSRLNPDAFERCFQEWMASMVQLSGGKLVAVDGKSLRRSFENGWDKSGMSHMVRRRQHTNHLRAIAHRQRRPGGHRWEEAKKTPSQGCAICEHLGGWFTFSLYLQYHWDYMCLCNFTVWSGVGEKF